MSVSPQPKSNQSSRPASPAADALEVLSLDDEAISPCEDAQRKSNITRKTSSWKGFKSHISKAAKSTFGESFTKDRKAVDGTAVSPTELSPDSVESGPESTSDENDKTEKISELIRNIEELGTECDREAVAVTPTKTPNSDKKRVDFIEEPSRKISYPVVEGAGASRPTELAFNRDSSSPQAPPRLKKEKRLERLLSVPNIKLNKQDQNRLLNLRKTSNVLEQKQSPPVQPAIAKNKGNFMRRFSKY